MRLLFSLLYAAAASAALAAGNNLIFHVDFEAASTQSRFPWLAAGHFFIAAAPKWAQVKLHGHLGPKWAIWNRRRLCDAPPVHAESAALPLLLW